MFSTFSRAGGFAGALLSRVKTASTPPLVDLSLVKIVVGEPGLRGGKK